METEHHLELPRGLQVDFAQKVQAITDARGGELTAAELMDTFQESYLDHTTPYELVAYTHSSEGDSDQIAARVLVDGEEQVVEGEGNGPIAALVNAIGRALVVDVHVRDYHEHAMSKGEDATAAAYVEADVDGDVVWGVGIHPSIVTASLRAVLNAVNRALALRSAQEAAAAAFDTT
jgi:2-isopropylmalate synthase